MSKTTHHAIIVTTYCAAHAQNAGRTARAMGLSTTGKVKAGLNCWWTFLVTPDGSKEGWAESDAGDTRREEFIAWLRGHTNSDGSNQFTWIEVEYHPHPDTGDYPKVTASAAHDELDQVWADD